MSVPLPPWCVICMDMIVNNPAWGTAEAGRVVPTREPGPLPAGVSNLEGAIQEHLLRTNHPHPLAEAARRVDAMRCGGWPTGGADRPVPAEQWSGGIHRPAERDDGFVTNKLRDWIWTHTSQPNGDPWDAGGTTALDQAAADLATTLRGA